MRAKDWTATSLGHPESWPQSLKTVIRIVLTSRYAMWMLWGPDLTFFCNDAYLPTVGEKESWVLGARSDKVWEEIWPEIGPRIQSVLTTDIATYDENLMLFLERNGYPEETYHTFSYSPLSNDEGKVVGMLCVVTEETEKVIGERRLALLGKTATHLASAHSEDELFQTLIQVCAGQRDLPFMLTYLAGEDPASPRLMASNDGGVLPQAIGDHVATHAQSTRRISIIDLPSSLQDVPKGPWEKAPARAAILSFIQGGVEANAGYLVVGLNPHRPYNEAYRHFLDLIAGQLGSMLTNVRARAAERKRVESLAEIDRAKTMFFSNISHEFRTPLTLMLSPLEELLNDTRGAVSSEGAELVGVAHRNALRLMKLVNALLDFSRIEAGRARAVFTSVDLGAITADLASNFRSTMERAGLALNIEVEAIPQQVFVDRDMWEKIILNLISNAFKFTFQGGVTVRVAPADGASVKVTVSDTGTGIPAHEIPKLFDRFHRVDGAKGRSVEGTGIGLSLVYELVKLHGGTVSIESEVGAGSTFTVMLPLGSAHLPPDHIQATAEGAPSQVRAETYVNEASRWLDGDVSDDALDGGLGQKGARIVFADDNADMRDYVARILSQRFEIEVVTDGQAALDACLRRRPDLLLTDVMMPRLDGFGLLQAVRARAELQGVPVILLSARAGEEARVDGLDAGADDYLVKPFSARELLARVSTIIELSKVRQASTVRLVTATEAAALGVFEWDIQADKTSWENKRAYEIFGRTEDEGPLNKADFIRERLHPEDVERFERELAEALKPGGKANIICRIRGKTADDIRWIEIWGVTQFSTDGVPLRMVGVAADITPRKETENHVNFLLREVNHRSKNLLALVQAVARQTARGSDPKVFAERFSRRLAGLAACQNLLVESEWTGVDASELVRSQLAHFADLIGTRIHIDGAPIRFDPAAAQTIAMALHELTTNAAKYGALTDPQGTIHVRWTENYTVTPAQFTMCWSEEGGPAITPPSHRGFGHRVLVQTVEMGLEATVAMSYEPPGLKWEFTAPLHKVIEKTFIHRSGSGTGSGYANSHR